MSPETMSRLFSKALKDVTRLAGVLEDTVGCDETWHAVNEATYQLKQAILLFTEQKKAKKRVTNYGGLAESG